MFLSILKLLKNTLTPILIINIIIFLLSGFIMLFKQQSFDTSLGQLITVFGTITIVISIVAPIGSNLSIKSFGYQFSRMASMDNQRERSDQDRKDMKGNFSYLIIMFLAGAIAIIIGWNLPF